MRFLILLTMMLLLCSMVVCADHIDLSKADSIETLPSLDQASWDEIAGSGRAAELTTEQLTHALEQNVDLGDTNLNEFDQQSIVSAIADVFGVVIQGTFGEGLKLVDGLLETVVSQGTSDKLNMNNAEGLTVEIINGRIVPVEKTKLDTLGPDDKLSFSKQVTVTTTNSKGVETTHTIQGVDYSKGQYIIAPGQTAVINGKQITANDQPLVVKFNGFDDYLAVQQKINDAVLRGDQEAKSHFSHLLSLRKSIQGQLGFKGGTRQALAALQDSSKNTIVILGKGQVESSAYGFAIGDQIKIPVSRILGGAPSRLEQTQHPLSTLPQNRQSAQPGDEQAQTTGTSTGSVTAVRARLEGDRATIRSQAQSEPVSLTSRGPVDALKKAGYSNAYARAVSSNTIYEITDSQGQKYLVTGEELLNNKAGQWKFTNLPATTTISVGTSSTQGIVAQQTRSIQGRSDAQATSVPETVDEQEASEKQGPFPKPRKRPEYIVTVARAEPPTGAKGPNPEVDLGRQGIYRKMQVDPVQIEVMIEATIDQFQDHRQASPLVDKHFVLSILKKETGYDPLTGEFVRKRGGCLSCGISQIQSGTVEGVNSIFKTNFDINSDKMDPNANVASGTLYLMYSVQTMSRLCSGCSDHDKLMLGAIAYNAGPGGANIIRQQVQGEFTMEKFKAAVTKENLIKQSWYNKMYNNPSYGDRWITSKVAEIKSYATQMERNYQYYQRNPVPDLVVPPTGPGTQTVTPPSQPARVPTQTQAVTPTPPLVLDTTTTDTTYAVGNSQIRVFNTNGPDSSEIELTQAERIVTQLRGDQKTRAQQLMAEGFLPVQVGKKILFVSNPTYEIDQTGRGVSYGEALAHAEKHSLRLPTTTEAKAIRDAADVLLTFIPRDVSTATASVHEAEMNRRIQQIGVSNRKNLLIAGGTKIWVKNPGDSKPGVNGAIVNVVTKEALQFNNKDHDSNHKDYSMAGRFVHSFEIAVS